MKLLSIKRGVDFLLVILFCPILLSAQKVQSSTPKDGFVLSGKKTDLSVDKLFLAYIGAEGKEVKDVIEVFSGNFEFVGKVYEPVLAWLYSQDLKVNVNFWLENDSFQLNKLKNEYIVVGGQTQKDQQLYNQRIAAVKHRIKVIDIQLRDGKGKAEPVDAEELKARKLTLEKEKARLTKNFIKNKRNSFVSLE